MYDWHSRHHTAHITSLRARRAGREPHGRRRRSRVSPSELAQTIEEYLADHPAAAVLEDGRVLFDMRTARYAVSEQHGRCLLQLWSEERNLMRTVVEVQERAQCLRLATRRMGAAKPQTLELVPTSDRRTPTAREAARRNYQRLLERVLTRQLHRLQGGRPALGDGPGAQLWPGLCARALLRGTAADAVIGVSEAESASMVDGVLTLGILWLDHCRQHGDGRRHFGGLKVIVPAGAWRTTAERMAWLNHAAADFQLFTLDERSEELVAVDFRDTGNLDSRLVHAFSAARPSSAARPASTGCWRWSRLPRRSGSRFAPARPPKWACCCMAWSLRACATALPPTPLPAKTRSLSAREPTRRRSRRRTSRSAAISVFAALPEPPRRRRAHRPALPPATGALA
jgi:hypothetical protein